MEVVQISSRSPMRLLVVFLLFLVPVGTEAGWDARVLIGTEALRKDLPSLPAAGEEVTLFGPEDHLPDLFLPLHKEKRAGSLVVVVPSDTPLEEENLSAWKKYVAGLSPGADNLFVLRDGALEGEVDGLPVRVVPIQGWKGGAGNGAVVLDLSFLTAMYKDEVRTPFVDLPRKFIATIEDRGLDPSRLRLWVADRGRVPLAHGYLPKLVSEIARNPGAFRGEIPRKWRELRQGEYLAFFSAYEEAVPHLQMYLEEEPEDPSVLFLLAQLHFVDREIERGLRFLRRAFKADAYYIRGYPEAALQFFRKGELESAERVLRAGLLQEPSTPELKQGLAYVLLEQAKKLLPGDPPGAEARFAEIGAIGLGDDFLRQIRAQWEKEKAAPGEKTRPPAGMSPHGHDHIGGIAE